MLVGSDLLAESSHALGAMKTWAKHSGVMLNRLFGVRPVCVLAVLVPVLVAALSACTSGAKSAESARAEQGTSEPLSRTAPSDTSQSPANACTANGVVIQVLGSGGPEMHGRASSGYLIRIDGKARVLVDAGGGTALRFGQSGARMSDLDVVLLSHLHADHSSDLIALIKSAHFEPRTRALPIVGPVGSGLYPSTTLFVSRLVGPEMGAWIYLGEVGNEATFELAPTDIGVADASQHVAWTGERIPATALGVHHHDVPTLAWRVEVGGKTIVFSGDTNDEDGQLGEFARGANVMVVHHGLAPGWHPIEGTLHMAPEGIAKVLGVARPDLAVLSHRRPQTLGKEPATVSIIRERFDGPLYFADDLDCFALSR